MIEPREYQRKAVENLQMKVESALGSPDNEVVIFQSPTGSGKTLMVSEALKKLVKEREDDKKFSFIWFLPFFWAFLSLLIRTDRVLWIMGQVSYSQLVEKVTSPYMRLFLNWQADLRLLLFGFPPPWTRSIMIGKII